MLSAACVFFFAAPVPNQISKGALFLGKAMVGSATVAGRLEGILVVGDMLTMRSSGHCDGVLRYGQLDVQVSTHTPEHENKTALSHALLCSGGTRVLKRVGVFYRQQQQRWSRCTIRLGRAR